MRNFNLNVNYKTTLTLFFLFVLFLNEFSALLFDENHLKVYFQSVSSVVEGQDDVIALHLILTSLFADDIQFLVAIIIMPFTAFYHRGTAQAAIIWCIKCPIGI